MISWAGRIFHYLDVSQEWLRPVTYDLFNELCTAISKIINFSVEEYLEHAKDDEIDIENHRCDNNSPS